MARIRTLKPEFWSDEKLAMMPVETRLLFLALISMADDCGRLVDSTPQIVAFLHPYTEDPEDVANVSRAIREGLATLHASARIVRGTTSSGQRVIQIANWSRHQKVDHPNTKAALPEVTTPQEVTEIRERFARDSREIRETVATDSRVDLRPTTSTSIPTTNDPLPKRAKKPRVTAPKENWVSVLYDWWLPTVGSVKPGHLANIAKAMYDLHGLDEIKRRAAIYFGKQGKPGFRSAQDFFATFAEWGEPRIASAKVRPEDMSPSERLRAMGAA